MCHFCDEVSDDDTVEVSSPGFLQHRRDIDGTSSKDQMKDEGASGASSGTTVTAYA